MEKENKPAFGFEAFKKQAAARLKKGETLLGKEDVFTRLIKEFLEKSKLPPFDQRYLWQNK